MFPAWSHRVISYKYQTPTPSTIPPLPPLSRHCTTADLEKPTCWNHLGRAQASRSHCQSHYSQGLLPLDPTRSSPAPSANRLPVLPHLFTTPKKKLGKKMKKSFFLPLPVPGPLRPSTVFVQIILSSKWTGVSLKVSRRNWQETGPGEEKVHQLFKTNCNRWHFNRLLKDVQQSIIQLYLQKVTL